MEKLALSVSIKLPLKTKKSVFAKRKVSRAKYFNSDLTQTPAFKLDHNVLLYENIRIYDKNTVLFVFFGLQQ